MLIAEIIKKLKTKCNLSNEDLDIIFHDLEQKNVNNKEIKEFVLAWREKKETISEISYLAKLLNAKQDQKELPKPAIDLCGTGGDKLNTFNISTLAAILASSNNLNVIKHSGKSTTSITGSVDILFEMGLDIDASMEIKESCFNEFGLMFVSSSILRNCFGEVKMACKEIGIPGFVNLIGPLSNPYKTFYHILGVSRVEWGDLMVSSLKALGNKSALVVCCKVNSDVCMDELSFCGENHIWELNNDSITKKVLLPADFQLEIENLNNLAIKDKSESKLTFESILKGETGPSLDPKLRVVALNAGAALYLTKKVKSLNEGYDLALRHIKTGKVWEHFQNFLNCNKKKRV